MQCSWYLAYHVSCMHTLTQTYNYTCSNKNGITGITSQSCSPAYFRARTIFFNKGLKEILFIAAIHSGNLSTTENDGEISSTISFSTRFGCHTKSQLLIRKLKINTCAAAMNNVCRAIYVI